MSTPDSREFIDRKHGGLSVRRQCALLDLARSGIYRSQPDANDNDLVLMRRMAVWCEVTTGGFGPQDCGHDAALGRRRRVAHMPTAATAAARSLM